MTSLRYRSDIDGLRALAVLGVVIYHAFPQNLPGGFIGVDIFFVISGYLISGILYKGHREGNFSYREFYARRIRRLFPALIIMMLLSLAYGWLVLLPEEFRKLGSHIAAGTVFAQNFVFWKESGYFDMLAELKPMLHLWSLAVEEQFYIVFPLVLVLLWKKPKILLPSMIVLLFASFSANILMSSKSPVADFFLTPYRAWEFLGGSLLAWWHYDRGHVEEVPKYREALSWAGMVFLVLGMIVLNKHQVYPGWRALLPVAGTLLLMEGGKGAWLNRMILSHPAVVWVGLISYPLYLFHWPILSYLHIIKGLKPWDGYLAMALVLSVLLAAVTYQFVEKRVRYATWRPLTAVLVVLFAAVGLVGLASSKGWLPARKLPSFMNPLLAAALDREMFTGFVYVNDNPKVVHCRIGGKGPQTLFVGDSNMQQYGPRIGRLLGDRKDQDRGAIFVTAPGVLAIPRATSLDVYQPADVVKKVKELLASDHRIDRVVMAARWEIYFVAGTHYIDGHCFNTVPGRAAALKELQKLLVEMGSGGRKVTLVLPIPDWGELGPESLYQRGFDGSFKKKLNPYRKQEFLAAVNNLHDEILGIGKSAGVEIIDPLDSLAKDGICITTDEAGVPIRSDGGHLRAGYVRDQLRYLDQTVAP